MNKIKTQIMIIGQSVQTLLAPTNLSRFIEIIQSFEFENLFIILWGYQFNLQSNVPSMPAYCSLQI